MRIENSNTVPSQEENYPKVHYYLLLLNIRTYYSAVPGKSGKYFMIWQCYHAHACDSMGESPWKEENTFPSLHLDYDSSSIQYNVLYVGRSKEFSLLSILKFEVFETLFDVFFRLSAADVDACFREFDRDGDHKLSYEEFCLMMNTRRHTVQDVLLGGGGSPASKSPNSVTPTSKRSPAVTPTSKRSPAVTPTSKSPPKGCSYSKSSSRGSSRRGSSAATQETTVD